MHKYLLKRATACTQTYLSNKTEITGQSNTAYCKMHCVLNIMYLILCNVQSKLIKRNNHFNGMSASRKAN